MLDARIKRRPRWALVTLLGLAMVVSHYSTTYVAITLTGSMLLLQWILSWFREFPRVTGAVAVAFIAALAGALIWYGPATDSSSSPEPLFNTIETQGFDVLPNLGNGQDFISAYLLGNTVPPMLAFRSTRSATPPRPLR